MRLSRFLRCLLLCLALTGPAAAQDVLRLEDALRAAESHPRFQAAAAEVEAARGSLLQAGLRPNPVLGLDVAVEDSGIVESVGAGLSQEFETGGKRAARVRAAQAALREAELALGEVRRQVHGEARRLFAQLLFAQGLEDVRRRGVEMARAQAELGRKRLEIGDVAGVEVIQLEADAARRQAEWEETVGLRRSRVAALTGLLGASGDLRADGTLGRPTPPLDLAALQHEARATRPDLAAAAARVDTRQAQVGLEESLAAQNITARLGISRERTFLDEDAIYPQGVIERIDDAGWVLGVGVEIPLAWNDANQGNIARARALVQAAAAERAALERTVTSEVGDAWERLVAARRQRAVLRDEVLPRARRAMEINEEAYRIGARTVLDLLQTRQVYLDALAAEWDAARAEEEALIDLEVAVGRDLSLEARSQTPRSGFPTGPLEVTP